MKFPNVLTREFIYMCCMKLADGIAVHTMYVFSTDKPYGFSLRIIDVICHFYAS